MTCCAWWVAKKGRFCKMTVRQGNKYCGEHMVMDASGERIPCPFDPKHSVDRADLEGHLLKCNARPPPPPPYYVENINMVSFIDDGDEGSMAAYDEVWRLLGFEPSTSPPASLPQVEMPDAQRHFLQRDALCNLIVPHVKEECHVVEMGAGKGHLSLHLKGKLSDKQVSWYLVDRSNYRRKADCQLSKAARIKMDISHLDLDGLIPREASQVVILGKHLCGAATCLTLRAAERLHRLRPHLPILLVAALCCHQHCHLGSFPTSLPLPPPLFRRLRQVSSWAVASVFSDDNNDDEDDDKRGPHPSGLRWWQRIEAGRAAKAWLNQQRQEWLLASGWRRVEIQDYVESTLTLENQALIASV